MRGGAARQLVGLITQRSQVQILPPLPEKNRGENPGLVLDELARQNNLPDGNTSFKTFSKTYQIPRVVVNE